MVQSDFDKSICNSVWAFLSTDDQNKIKEMKGNAKNVQISIWNCGSF